MIKDIVVKLERDQSRDAVREFAFSVAQAFEAHVTGVAFAHAGIPPFALTDVPADVIQKVLSESAALARQSVKRFQHAAARAGISDEHRLVAESDLEPAERFSEIARAFDLSVIMQSDARSGVHNDLMIEAALFGSGRPVMIVPFIQKDGLQLDRVMCCWDGSRAATRAINDALPLLRKAKAVQLFTASTNKRLAEAGAGSIEIGRHLARHGVRLEVEVMPATDNAVADVILSHAADSSATLIVMGGYGHSRLREFVLGGATRGLLSAMTVPVFMSH